MTDGQPRRKPSRPPRLTGNPRKDAKIESLRRSRDASAQARSAAGQFAKGPARRDPGA